MSELQIAEGIEARAKHYLKEMGAPLPYRVIASCFNRRGALDYNLQQFIESNVRGVVIIQCKTARYVLPKKEWESWSEEKRQSFRTHGCLDVFELKQKRVKLVSSEGVDGEREMRYSD